MGTSSCNGKKLHSFHYQICQFLPDNSLRLKKLKLDIFMRGMAEAFYRSGRVTSLARYEIDVWPPSGQMLKLFG